MSLYEDDTSMILAAALVIFFPMCHCDFTLSPWGTPFHKRSSNGLGLDDLIHEAFQAGLGESDDNNLIWQNKAWLIESFE